MATPIVRQCGPEDAGRIRSVRLRMLRYSPEAYDADLAAAEAKPARHWVEWAAGTTDVVRATWLAWADDVPVGMVAATLRADHCEVGALWVDEGWRGCGVGRGLMDAAEMWAHSMRAVYCSLSVAEGNVAACRLYLSLHYAYTGLSKVTRSGTREVYMRKRVGR